MKIVVGLMLLAVLMVWGCETTNPGDGGGPGRHLRHVWRLGGWRLFSLQRRPGLSAHE